MPFGSIDALGAFRSCLKEKAKMIGMAITKEDFTHHLLCKLFVQLPTVG